MARQVFYMIKDSCVFLVSGKNEVKEREGKC